MWLSKSVTFPIANSGTFTFHKDCPSDFPPMTQAATYVQPHTSEGLAVFLSSAHCFSGLSFMLNKKNTSSLHLSLREPLDRLKQTYTIICKSDLFFTLYSGSHTANTNHHCFSTAVTLRGIGQGQVEMPQFLLPFSSCLFFKSEFAKHFSGSVS